MLRKWLFSMAVILLLSSGALACIGLTPASIGNAQNFGIDAINVMRAGGCVGSAEGSNIVMVGHAQEAYDVASGTSALQEETATLTQSGNVVGNHGSAAVVQTAQANGTQEQLVGLNPFGIGTSSQNQSLGVNLDMLTKNTRGIGGAVGAQSFVGAQSQIEITPNGMSSQTQFVGVAQFSTVTGTNASVNNSVDVVLEQSQDVVGGP